MRKLAIRFILPPTIAATLAFAGVAKGQPTPAPPGSVPPSPSASAPAPPPPSPPAPSSAAAPAPPPPSSAAAPAPQPPAGQLAPAETRPATAPPAVPGFVVLPRVGLRLAGSGDSSGKGTTCIGGACTSRDGSAGYDDRSDFGLGVDALFRAGSSLRLGAGLWYIPTWRVASGEQSAEIGSELSLPLIVEGILPASPTTLIAIRGQGGPLLFKTGGAYADGLDCERSSQETPLPPTGYAAPARSCESEKGPFFGYTWGGAMGAIFLAGNTRLRADLLLQGYHVPGGYKKVGVTYPAGASSSSYATEKKETLSGTRVWLTFGVEL